MIFKVNNNS